MQIPITTVKANCYNVIVMFRAKICGITNLEDAILAASLGAWAIGFIFAESPRRLNFSVAGQIATSLPKDLLKVGVFVDPPLEVLEDAVRSGGIDVFQFHGNESPDFCSRVSTDFGLPVLKAVSVRDARSIEDLDSYDVNAFLLDSFSDSVYGGSGRTFDWSIASAAKRYGKIILSGGLNASNLDEAIIQVQPYAIDLSTGVEDSPGKKNHQKLKETFRILSAK